MMEPRHDRTAPRSWWSLFFAVGGYFVILAGLALFGFTIWSSVDYRKATMFDRDGVGADAEIVSKRTVESDDDTDYDIVFAYQAGERLVKVERSVSSGFYYDWSVGSDAPIRYMPNRTTRMEYYIGGSR
ncbi:hypothetical protein [Cognatiyoonia sp.]|uniref:hypothetical protein n=1 Tax=Cognatiyoonia sp. TaxID=2211652 RepID=UPI003F6A4A32